MKRYTGQQALYEAISRSRAKAKQGTILERLRPESPNPEDAAAHPSPMAESEPTSPPVVQESAEPQIGVPPEPAVEQQSPAGPVAMPAELLEHSEPTVTVRPVERVAHPVSPSPVQTWLKPRPVQLNEGRIEISVPYYIGAIAGLVVLVVVLTAFRLGQTRSGGRPTDAGKQVQPASDKTGVTTNSSTPSAASPNAGRPQPATPAAGRARQDVAAAAVQGDNWIVLAQYRDRKDLEPVKEHFARHGIDLGIMPLDDVSRKEFADSGFNASVLPAGVNFLLVTKSLYSNPRVPGTDGYAMKQKITEVGALYKGKAPAGCESFSPNYFSDAYPMKIR